MKKQSGEMEKRGGGALGGHVFKAIAVLLGYLKNTSRKELAS